MGTHWQSTRSKFLFLNFYDYGNINMRIDFQTGDIYIEKFGKIIWNGITEEDLKETKFYQDNLEKEWQTYENVRWYIFKPVQVLNQELSISYIFVDHFLDGISFRLPTQKGDPKGWEDWSEEKEIKIMLRYSDFFSQLPDMPKPQKNKYWRLFGFKWGGLCSQYDLKSQSTMCGLHYKKLSQSLSRL